MQGALDKVLVKIEYNRSIPADLNVLETEDSLELKLVRFSAICDEFFQQINEKCELPQNCIPKKRKISLYRLMELPDLMEALIHEKRYEEALMLDNYSKKLEQLPVNMPVINNIVQTVANLRQTMKTQLVLQLLKEFQLTKCIEIVGYLRRLDNIDRNEIRKKFLQGRDAWLQASLLAIPKDDAQKHLIKTMEVTRTKLFSIINQYNVLFSNDDEDKSVKNTYFETWLHRRIDELLEAMNADLKLNSFKEIFGRCFSCLSQRRT